MDDSLYDEFGNYIGPEIESDRESDGDDQDEDIPDKPDEEEMVSDVEDAVAASNGWITASNDVDMDNQIVLAEDKKYYPTAEEVYGEDVETLVMDEDEQPLEQPIIKPVRNIKFELGVKDSSTYVSTQFLLGLMSNSALVRNVALVGHLQHGKTLFMDMLVEQTHHISTFDSNSEKHMRYTDTRIDEQERRISIKAVPMSLVLEDSNSKSYLCNIMDTPGHVNFSDEMTAALRLADGAVLIVDAAEGVMVSDPFLWLLLLFLFRYAIFFFFNSEEAKHMMALVQTHRKLPNNKVPHETLSNPSYPLKSFELEACYVCILFWYQISTIRHQPSES